MLLAQAGYTGAYVLIFGAIVAVIAFCVGRYWS
jgi:hypothetical protein